MVAKTWRFENLVFNNIGPGSGFKNIIVSLGVVNGLGIKINIKIFEHIFFIDNLNVEINLEVGLNSARVKSKLLFKQRRCNCKKKHN